MAAFLTRISHDLGFLRPELKKKKTDNALPKDHHAVTIIAGTRWIHSVCISGPPKKEEEKIAIGMESRCVVGLEGFPYHCNFDTSAVSDVSRNCC